jgi:hypothetical protein
MSKFKRTVSALALGVALATGSAGLATISLAPTAVAQDALATPAAKLEAALSLQGIPAGVLKWASVEESGEGLIARGVYADVAQYNIGFSTLPLGDLEVTDLVIEGNYVTQFSGRFTGITANLAELMTTGQAMGQATSPDPAVPNPAAQMGGMLAMGAGYLQGLGYTAVNATIDFENSVDLATGEAEFTSGINLADMFNFGVAGDMTGVDAAYLDWAKANTAKIYSQSPEAQAEMNAAMADPNSPISKVGISGFSIAFADLGLMDKLEPQLAPMRQGMMGTNPDGTPKTELSEADLQAAAQQMAASSGLGADKLLPVITALYAFVVNPDKINLGVDFEPALKMSEIAAASAQASGQAPASGATPTDWNSRVTLNASN